VTPEVATAAVGVGVAAVGSIVGYLAKVGFERTLHRQDMLEAGMVALQKELNTVVAGLREKDALQDERLMNGNRAFEQMRIELSELRRDLYGNRRNQPDR